MNKYTIITVVSAIVGMAQAACWSSVMGYDCCQSCDVAYEDDTGKWGVENNNWCGIDTEKCNSVSCWSLPAYPCCQSNSIAYYSDEQGDWGVENGNWCGIIKSSNNNNQQPNNDVPQNNDEPQTPQEDLNLPKFSMESGFYEDSNGLTLTLSGEGTIYYTLDSSNPTTSNTAQTYSSPIKLYDRSVDENVISKHGHQDNSPFSTTLQNPYTPSDSKFDKLNIVRAAVKLADGTWSPVITKSFIVMSSDKLKYYKDIPVVSLVTDPVNLFDKDKGIYVCGQQYLNWKNSPQFNPAKSEWDYDNVANFFSKGKEWERDGAISIFRNGKEELNQNVGIRLKGASTRNHQTKSFNIFARKEYGDSKIRYEVIDDNVNFVTGEKIDKYDSFGIRGVYWFDRMRDNIVQTGLEDSPVIATYNSNRCVLFLDGEFWGLYDLIEKASDYYIESNYGIPKENVALIKNDELEEGTEQDLQDFKDLVKYCSTNDLTNAANYEYVASKLDLESLIYHYAIGFYLGIWDWPNRNYLVYRNKGEAISGNPYSDGKWRYGAFDFDYSTGITYDTFGGVEGYAHDSFKKFQNKKDEFPTPIFSGLIKNKTFYKQFADVMNLMSQKIFEPGKMVKIVEEHKSKYMNYIVETDWRWQSGTPTANYDSFKSKQVGYFTGGWDAVSDFFKNRPQYVYNFMEGTYGKP